VNGWRQRLQALFRAVVADLDPRAATAAALRGRFPDPAAVRLLAIAFGKAARPMAEAVVAAGPWASLRGLVVPPAPDAAELPPFAVIPGGHPLPDAGSLAAGARALDLARGAGPDEMVLFLVSGGGSALLEQPADPAVPLAELRALYAALVGCGADIRAVNTVRRACSAVKGGRLLLAAAAARARVSIAVSDVPLEAAGTLASGPTEPDPGTAGECRAVLDHFALWPAVPPALRARLERGDLPPGPGPSHPVWARSEFTVALDPRHALHQLVQRARRLGLRVVAEPGVDDLPYGLAAARLLARLDRLRRRRAGRAVAIAAVGELSVRLPPAPGQGGRNQQFALHCARAIRGLPIAVLSAGTDGIDGNSPAAGAVADGTTWARARRLGLDPSAHLHRCDAFPLFAALGDAVVTGPTGTNVRDLRLVVHCG